MGLNKFGKYAFYLIGTCIILSMFTIVSLNFYNDSGVFGASQQAFAQLDDDINQDDYSDLQTLKYKRNYTIEADDEKNKDKDANKKALSVELIDYTKEGKLGDKVKSTLVASGFNVSLSHVTKNTRKVSTKIIERNDKGAASVVFKLLKSGKIYKDYKLNYKYDVTLILGDDYNP